MIVQGVKDKEYNIPNVPKHSLWHQKEMNIGWAESKRQHHLADRSVAMLTSEL